MSKKITSSDVYDINKKTGALILGKNRLDDYATKFLNKYCKEALDKPIALPVDEILNNMGLNVQEVSLSKDLDVFGCCLLLDGYVDVINQSTGVKESKLYKAGTVLIDPVSEEIYGRGSRRNTLIHEAVHWEKDKTYFEIQKIKNGDEYFYPVLDRRSDVFTTPSEGKKTKTNEIAWLEWQAHRLAPRILMPRNTFCIKANEFIEEKKINSCDDLINELSCFFEVSKISAKIRLQEVELLYKLKDFNDYESFYGDLNTKQEFVKLTPVEAFNFISKNKYFADWVEEKQFIFVEGYFVLADTAYVSTKNGELVLTKKAKRNLSKCAINICEQKSTSYTYKYNSTQIYSLLRIEGVDKRLLTFHPNYQSLCVKESEAVYGAFANFLMDIDDDAESEFMTMLREPSKTLCNCLWYLLNKSGITLPETFNEQTQLHKNYLGKIRNDKYNNMGKDVLLPICIALKLPLRTIEKLFEKSDYKLNYNKDPDKTYIKIIEYMPGLSLWNFNLVLEQFGIKELGSDIRKK